MDVDVVVMWVDGSDPEWLEEKKHYQAEEDIRTNDSVNRYRDWNLMKYWFRGIEFYAPWVRKVHFVTWGHLPSFLDPDCEKLNIVRHTDFMPAECLPTYSSKALECNLWRIPGLAERFVYFNDDFFLTRPTRLSDFFDEKTGLPRLPFEEIPIRFDSADCTWQMTVGSDIGIINSHISKRERKIKEYPGRYLSRCYPMTHNIRSLMMKLLFPEYYVGFKNYHAPAPFLLSAFKEVWEKEYETMMLVSRHRFRVSSDPNQWVILWWQLARGTFLPKRNGHYTYSVDEDTIDEICARISGRTAESICINDPDYDVDFETLAGKLQEAFQKVLPEKCSFER